MNITFKTTWIGLANVLDRAEQRLMIPYTTRSFEAGVDVYGNSQGIDDDFNEDYGIEYCTMCSEVIPRGSANWIDFEVPYDFERC